MAAGREHLAMVAQFGKLPQPIPQAAGLRRWFDSKGALGVSKDFIAVQIAPGSVSGRTWLGQM